MNLTIEGEIAKTRLWHRVSHGRINVMQGLQPKHLSTSSRKTEADLNYEYTTSGAFKATTSRCILIFN